ncbi:MAG: SPFH domain-containing protein [Planctomycetota bacterium]
MNHQSELIIRESHRALWYEDGKFIRLLEPGRYELPKRPLLGGKRVPQINIEYVDIRERDLTIKGQEILTADKVAIRVSILLRYRVIDPVKAIHEVEDFSDRLYSDVQLAARRSLASMNLEEILTNRTRLSEDILAEVQDPATGYGVRIKRADVKDLIFPGNLQEVMNRVLMAERMSQAELVDARTKAQVREINAKTEGTIRQQEAAAEAESIRLKAQADAEVERMKHDLEVEQMTKRAEVGEAMAQTPQLLRLAEIEAMQALAANANARLYIGFDKHADLDD